LRILAIVLPTFLLVISMLWGFRVMTPHWPLSLGLPLAMEALVAAALWRKTRAVTDNIVLPSFELGTIAPLLRCLEEQQFQCSLLRSLQSRLLDGQTRSSRQLAKLRVLARLLDLRRSEYFAVALSLVLWGTNLAFAVECWRKRNRSRLPGWLEALGQFEALLCLARYAYENPTHTFPILPPETPALFKADSLGHPLLERSSCVPCDVTLNSGCRFLMVSGSNMSGKSTLLRSVGLNAVLAFAGAPVRAARLEISPLRIGSSIAVHDSLMRGTSRFAAEVERLKQIIAVARDHRVLFLLDEMLGGTNSADRFFGAKAVLDELLRSNAIGLVTTHDLALTDLVREIPCGGNVHFEEQYKDGQMRFDYTMRPGVLTHTNGLNVMAAMGLRSS
jgi:DNA mismatch repair ATPase MutS